MSADCTRIFKDKKEISTWLQKLNRKGNISKGDWLLLKGSRGMKMETILHDLEQGRTD
jgi:murE/murF fusion protein